MTLFGVVACATLPRPSASGATWSAWEQRKAVLSELSAWTARGRVAVIHDNQAWHASLRWVQRHDHYDVQLLGPFGQGGARLSGTPGEMTLALPDREPLWSDQPDELVSEYIGWQIPVRTLPRWMIGLADDDADIELDADGRLIRAVAAGWKLEYARYVDLQLTDFPEKMVMERDGWRVKLVIDEWTFGDPGAGLSSQGRSE